MATVSTPPPGLRQLPPRRVGIKSRSPAKLVSAAMMDGSMVSNNDGKEEANANNINVAGRISRVAASSSPPNMAPIVVQLSGPSEPSDLRFDRLQPSDRECDCRHKRVFGRFLAREAMLDEEYWTAAWLRAESNWEDQLGVRHVESLKKKYAEQEFNALKRRCEQQHAEKCICIVAVKNDKKNINRTVLSSIVGTLDINIRHLLHGEIFPRESEKGPAYSSIYQADRPKYGYVSNVCVAKYARRQGIASNMLLLAIDAAKAYGAEKIFVHVRKDNIAAQRLYEQIGFKMIDVDGPLQTSENYLLSFRT